MNDFITYFFTFWYSRLIRPVGNSSDRLTVKMGLKLSQVRKESMHENLHIFQFISGFSNFRQLDQMNLPKPWALSFSDQVLTFLPEFWVFCFIFYFPMIFGLFLTENMVNFCVHFYISCQSVIKICQNLEFFAWVNEFLSWVLSFFHLEFFSKCPNYKPDLK